MTGVLTATTDPEAAAFFADARAALEVCNRPTPVPSAFKLPESWPITQPHTGATITVPELHACRSHALRISYDWGTVRQAKWVAEAAGFGWSVMSGNVDEPAVVWTSPHTWDAAVRGLNALVAPSRSFGGVNLAVDEWLPEFATVCVAHGDTCEEQGNGHNFVQRRTLPRYPVGTRRPCGGCKGGDGTFRYRFQVDGRWRLRFGCRSHHPDLLARFLTEADGTLTVLCMDDHFASTPAVEEVPQ